MCTGGNKKALKRLTEPNGTPAMDLEHMNFVLMCCICLLVGDFEIGSIIPIMIINCMFFLGSSLFVTKLTIL